jgi:hypothetical protein
VLFFSIYFNYAVPRPTRVRCQCDAVVLIKIVIFAFLFFSIYFNYAVHAPYTVRCQCDAVVLIKIVILCAFFPFILIM